MILIFKRILGLNCRKAVVGIALQEKAGIAYEVKLAQQDLLCLSHNQHGQFSHSVAGLPFVAFYNGVILLATCLEAARLLQHQVAVVCQLEQGLLLHHFYLTGERCLHAPCHSIIVKTEFNGITTLHVKCEQGVIVLHLTILQGEERLDCFLYSTHALLLQSGFGTQCLVTQLHANHALLQQRLIVAYHIIIDTVRKRYVHTCLSVGTLGGHHLLGISREAGHSHQNKGKDSCCSHFVYLYLVVIPVGLKIC